MNALPLADLLSRIDADRPTGRSPERSDASGPPFDDVFDVAIERFDRERPGPPDWSRGNGTERRSERADSAHERVAERHRDRDVHDAVPRRDVDHAHRPSDDDAPTDAPEVTEHSAASNEAPEADDTRGADEAGTSGTQTQDAPSPDGQAESDDVPAGPSGPQSAASATGTAAAATSAAATTAASTTTTGTTTVATTTAAVSGGVGDAASVPSVAAVSATGTGPATSGDVADPAGPAATPTPLPADTDLAGDQDTRAMAPSSTTNGTAPDTGEPHAGATTADTPEVSAPTTRATAAPGTTTSAVTTAVTSSGAAAAGAAADGATDAVESTAPKDAGASTRSDSTLARPTVSGAGAARTGATGRPAASNPTATPQSAWTPPTDTGRDLLAQADLNRLTQSGTRVGVDLTTAELGSVRVEASQRAGQLQVDLLSELAATRTLLSQHAEELRDDLRANGLDLESVDVRTGRDGAPNGRSARHGDAGGQPGRAAARPNDGPSADHRNASAHGGPAGPARSSAVDLGDDRGVDVHL